MVMGIVGIPQNARESHGMVTNVAGLPQKWDKIVWDSRENAALFDFHGAPAATEICFQTVERCLL